MSAKYAVIKTGGKQYRVQPGDELRVELLSGSEAGAEVIFEEVLLVAGEGDLKVGRPIVEGAQVKAKLIQNGRARKIIVFKSRRRAGYRKKRGHRQHYSQIRITEITA